MKSMVAVLVLSVSALLLTMAYVWGQLAYACGGVMTAEATLIRFGVGPSDQITVWKKTNHCEAIAYLLKPSAARSEAKREANQ